MSKTRKICIEKDESCRSADQLREGCENVGLRMTDSAVRGMLEEVHSDGDAGWENQVSMDRFRGLIMKYFEGGTTENMAPEERSRYKREQRKKKTIEVSFQWKTHLISYPRILICYPRILISYIEKMLIFESSRQSSTRWISMALGLATVRLAHCFEES